MALRVLWVSKGLGPGGAERLLVAAAATIDHDEFDVRAVYVLPWKDHLAGELERHGVPATCLSSRRRDLRWPWRLRNAMDGVDVVHTHSPVPAVVARLVSLTLPRSRRPALMTTEHNSWASHRAATRWANRLTSGLDDCTIAVTDEAAASLRGAAARRVEVVTHGIDVAGIAGADRATAAIRDELELPDCGIVIGTVANFRAQKDYPNLMAAARLMIDRGVDFRIVAVGQGPDEQRVVDLRDELGLADHVVFAGFRPDAVDVMAACDVFVLASAWEGLPVAVMEALALGLPIVATRVGGVAESLEDSEAILVAPRAPDALATALTEVITSGERREELAARSRAAAQRFDVGNALTRVTDHYLDLAAASQPERSVVPVPDATSRSRSRQPKHPPLPIRPMTDHDIDATIALLGASLGWGDDERYRRLFEWKHRTNPFGPSRGWVAESSGEIVAVRLFVNWRFRRGHQTLRAVRAVDTATHPDFQGRGLFTALTTEALDACREDGVSFVFNTPNAQSRPGYLKMGWRDVGRPAVAIRTMSPRSLPAIARSRVPAERWSLPIDVGIGVDVWLERPDRAGAVGDETAVSSTDRTLRTDRTDAFLRWRYGLDDLRYRVVDDGVAAVIVRLRRRGSGRELVVADAFGPRSESDRLAATVGHDVSATHVLRLGSANVRRGFVPMPGIGPDLTWRAVNDTGQPPLSNWGLRMGDIELF